MSDLLSIYNELQSKKWVDLTHKINAESPHFPALPALKQEDLFTLKDGFHVQKFTVVGQYGTHIDAPIHFVEGGGWMRLLSKIFFYHSMLSTSLKKLLLIQTLS